MSFKKKADTPLYASAFVDNGRFVVGGGGGQGAHGVLNKMFAYSITAKDVVLLADHILPDNSDCVASMCEGQDGIIWVGANIPSSRGIKHLHQVKLTERSKDEVTGIDAAEKKLVKDDKSTKESSGKKISVLEMYDQYDLFKNNDITIYQKNAVAVGTMVACVSSDESGKVAILSTTAGDLIEMNFGNELVDATMTEYDEKEHRYVAAASESRIEIRSITKPKVSSFPFILPPHGTKWSRIVSTSPSRFVAAVSPVDKKAAAQLVTIDLKDDKAIITNTVKIPNFPSVTAIATSGPKVAVGSPYGDVCVFNAQHGKPILVRKLRFQHKLPVTSLALSPNGDSVVSTSLDGSYAVNKGLNSPVNVPATIALAALLAFLLAGIVILVTQFTVTEDFMDFPFENDTPSAVLGTIPGPTPEPAGTPAEFAEAVATPELNEHSAEPESAAHNVDATGSEGIDVERIIKEL